MNDTKTALAALMEKVTPGPWNVTEYDNGFTGAHGLEGIFAAGSVAPIVESVWGGSIAHADANARLIVLAVNHFAEMVALLERLVVSHSHTAYQTSKKGCAHCSAMALLARLEEEAKC